MTISSKIGYLVPFALLLFVTFTARADVFSEGPNRYSMNFISVGNPGNAGNVDVNPADNAPISVGSVAYPYRISATETASSWYIEFLNAVQTSGSQNYRASGMNSSSNDGSRVERIGVDGSYSYQWVPGSLDSDTAGRPIGGTSFLDMARYANWLQAGQPTGAGARALTDKGAYDLTAAGNARYVVQPGARYWIATENEWYKAAYFDPAKNGGSPGYWLYPTKSDTVPVNEPFRTSVLNPLGIADNTTLGNPQWHNNPSPVADPGNNANYKSTDLDGNVYSGFTRPFNSNVSNAGFMGEVGYFENSKSHYGMLDAGGNQWEFMPTTKDGTTNAVLRGGAYNSGGGNDLGTVGTHLAGTHTVVVPPGTGGGGSTVRGGRIDMDPSYLGFEHYNFGWRIASLAEIIPGDVNADLIVNGQDISLVASNWLATGYNQADANNDQIVNGQDISIMASNWLGAFGGGSGAAAAVPEPATFALVGIAALSWAAQRRLRRKAAAKS